MRIYCRQPAKGFAGKLVHYHVWSIGRTQHHCWHYEVTDEDASKLIALGGKPVETPWTCIAEQHGRD